LTYTIAKEHLIPEGNNRVILATDGDFNVGTSSDAELVRLIEEKRKENIFLTVLGFGMGNYKDGKMEKLADKGNGNYAYIDTIREAKKVFVSELGGTLLTIAKDVKIQIEFNPAKVKAYRLIGYENRLLAKEDFEDDTKDAGELGAGHSVTALYELISSDSEEEVRSAGDLKYQKTGITSEALQTNEIMMVSLRYKQPDGSESLLLTQPVIDAPLAFERTSENFRFSSAVAEFGLLLRDSQFKGEATYGHVLQLAQASKGQDAEGYRAEFIRLAETVELLERNTE
jgi:Ca-activated chloride channel family protein